ncbi:MAG: WD40/YVTN/BNR-like repeat-containing protein [Anaerolineae bacterium]
MAQELLLLATTDGLVVAERSSNDWVEVSHTLYGRHLTSIVDCQGIVLIGSVDGIFRSTELNGEWQGVNSGLTVRHIRWLSYHPDISPLVIAGTEPAAIFTSHNGADTWQERPEVGIMRKEYGWFLPYSPRAGCVRGFAFHDGRGYAAVEQGGLLRSDDYADTWVLAPGSNGKPRGTLPPSFIHPDVHSVVVHHSSPDLLFAATGGGLYRSRDGGATFQRIHDCYCRAVWVDPADPDHLIFGPAEGVDKGGRIEETFDGGQTWHLANEGLDAPWPDHMMERLVHAGNELLAVLSNGKLASASLKDLVWRNHLPGVTSIETAIIFER